MKSTKRTKREARKAMCTRRDQLDPDCAQAQGREILRRFVELDDYRQARCMACYVSVGREVETRDLIRMALSDGKQVGVPVTRPHGQMDFQRIGSLDALRPAPFGLLEPERDASAVIAPEAFDLVIVPGAAFDRKGNRLGLGGGYYDRFLEQTPGKRVALIYGFQVVDTVPIEPHDLKVDMIVTQDEVIHCSL